MIFQWFNVCYCLASLPIVLSNWYANCQYVNEICIFVVSFLKCKVFILNKIM